MQLELARQGHAADDHELLGDSGLGRGDDGRGREGAVGGDVVCADAIHIRGPRRVLRSRGGFERRDLHRRAKGAGGVERGVVGGDGGKGYEAR